MANEENNCSLVLVHEAPVTSIKAGKDPAGNATDIRTELTSTTWTWKYESYIAVISRLAGTLTPLNLIQSPFDKPCGTRISVYPKTITDPTIFIPRPALNGSIMPRT
jgi:hypothetical protein